MKAETRGALNAPRGDLRPSSGLRVAIIHYWLVGMRGGEQVLEALCRMFPQADIYTHAYLPAKVSPAIRRHKITTTSVGRLPFAPKLYTRYLPLMPRALEEIDLAGYDLVISSEAGPAKGVIAPPDAVHLCYCHSPMRYLWDQYHTYRNGAGLLTRTLMPPLAAKLRSWDVVSAARVDAFAANSHHVAARIRKYWRRESTVVHPPVALDQFAPVAPEARGDFYLWAGELAPYKRPDIAIEAFNRLQRPLVVIGGPGRTVRALSAKAGDTIRFLGHAPYDVLKQHLAACRALIFPGEEDFGIVPVEAMASGRPVIAYGRGGALDTVRDGETGLLFRDQSVEGLVDAVTRFEAEGLEDLDPMALRDHARQFDEASFVTGLADMLAAEGIAFEPAPGAPAA
ncbi:glycosyltransferase [Profundibacterium mesophilum]|uniref:Glycoprotein 3-alpha-L-fucosyltransferase n=1 Tax=Profundibacterium mesophilum KAUST100406-0324 TaxID=1037889 RepID=A0A921NPY3_9RHOB|nr:glycosyltransferase [Profundibacterium mesophilum]KAF0675862.1 glycoprotein 3-alpha-L-fucosyltransferase [Profundibacterium mesophilum KAUST100406-0324]